MERTFKPRTCRGRGSEIIFDDRIDAANPREARTKLKEQLGVESLSGIVYAITEIPVDLIREIVDVRVAELLNGAAPEPPREPVGPPTAPDWSLVQQPLPALRESVQDRREVRRAPRGSGSPRRKGAMGVNVEVKRYKKPEGYATRYWAVYVDGELLAVVLYRKGAEAVADRLMDLARPPPWSGRVAEE